MKKFVVVVVVVIVIVGFIAWSKTRENSPSAVSTPAPSPTPSAQQASFAYDQLKLKDGNGVTVREVNLKSQYPNDKAREEAQNMEMKQYGAIPMSNKAQIVTLNGMKGVVTCVEFKNAAEANSACQKVKPFEDAATRPGGEGPLRFVAYGNFMVKIGINQQHASAIDQFAKGVEDQLAANARKFRRP
jgi:hypothetical protein